MASPERRLGPMEPGESTRMISKKKCVFFEYIQAFSRVCLLIQGSIASKINYHDSAKLKFCTFTQI